MEFDDSCNTKPQVAADCNYVTKMGLLSDYPIAESDLFPKKSNRPQMFIRRAYALGVWPHCAVERRHVPGGGSVPVRRERATFRSQRPNGRRAIGG